jgi:hypothetical protein
VVNMRLMSDAEQMEVSRESKNPIKLFKAIIVVKHMQ